MDNSALTWGYLAALLLHCAVPLFIGSMRAGSRKWGQQMKLVVLGLGQCGGRIADEFARLNKRAESRRGVKIITGAYAVNSDEADLSGLETIPSDYQHRILMGGRKTIGHGVGKISSLAAEVTKESADKIIDALRVTPRFYETDAFLLVASGAGGTGSGGLPVLAEIIKKRYSIKPVYSLIVLPFEHEEDDEARSIVNTATCLKSAYSVADAVFLADNQRYVRRDGTLINNMSEINRQIVSPFYNLLCAGEETKRKHIGARVVDAGDIIQTLGGWTTIGYGKSSLGLWMNPLERKRNFRKKGAETHVALQAMDEALCELSVDIRPADVGSAVYVLSAPAKEMSMDAIKETGDYLKQVAPSAQIRGGDYPREKGELSITMVLSQICDVDRVKEYYPKLKECNHVLERIEKEKAAKVRVQEMTWSDVPVLVTKGNRRH